MQETLYQTAGAGDTLSDSGCRSLPIRQRMQEYLHLTADAEDSIRQRMQETLYQTADAGHSLSDIGCRSISFQERMQETLYQTADAGVSLTDN